MDEPARIFDMINFSWVSAHATSIQSSKSVSSGLKIGCQLTARMQLYIPCSNARSATFSCNEGTDALSTDSLVKGDVGPVGLEGDAAHRKCSLPPQAHARTHPKHARMPNMALNQFSMIITVLLEAPDARAKGKAET